MTKQHKNSKNSINKPRRSRASTPILSEEVDQQSSQTQSSNSRRSEALRNLQERVPGLRVPNYIDIVDDNENREPELPASSTINTSTDTPIAPEEG